MQSHQVPGCTYYIQLQKITSSYYIALDTYQPSLLVDLSLVITTALTNKKIVFIFVHLPTSNLTS